MTGDGLMYLLDVTGRSLAGITEQRDTLNAQVEQLTKAIGDLNGQLAAVTRERDELLHLADKAPE